MKNALEELLDLAAKDDTNDDPWLMAYGIERQARDLHELYKEAAEDGSRRQIFVSANGLEWACMSCNRNEVYNPDRVHAADCKAARILGLKMEGAT